VQGRAQAFPATPPPLIRFQLNRSRHAYPAVIGTRLQGCAMHVYSNKDEISFRAFAGLP
jgi:hypothetical protein